MKKKAPCGQTQRSDLPWCCHRRLGEWVNLLTIGHDENGNIVFHGEHNWLPAQLLKIHGGVGLGRDASRLKGHTAAPAIPLVSPLGCLCSSL